MNKNVWLVHADEHIDRYLFGVFSSKELAEVSVMRAFGTNRRDVEIREWILNQPIF